MGQKGLKINVVGSFTIGLVGETADEVLIAREFERLGHKVTKVPRDIWKAYVDGDKPNDDWVLPKPADISIICKWHHFEGQHVSALREYGPVIYWTWDWMQWPTPPKWHDDMVTNCDLHLRNDDGPGYYFPMDFADGDLPVFSSTEKKNDVVFFGSCLDQGDRKEYITELAKDFNIKIYAWNYQDWQKMGIEAEPPVWGVDFNRVVGESKICLQFSVNDHIWGYWSNRVGKVLTAGGFLLARYTPGMELAIGDCADYFNSIDEAREKIRYYLDNDSDREDIARKGKYLGERRFTAAARIKDLEILIKNRWGTNGN